MSQEYSGSSKHEQSKLYSLRISTILGFAEKTDNQDLLERLLNITAERALAEEFDLEADDAAVFIYKKLEALRQKSSEDSRIMEVNVQELVDADYAQEREFCAIYPYYFQEDDPQIAEKEREHEALFKQQ